MSTIIFWILAVWFVVNVIWMWFVRDKQNFQKTFAWINVAAVIIGFLTYFLGTRVNGGLSALFNVLNYVNIIVAIVQFYFGYSHGSSHTHSHSVA